MYMFTLVKKVAVTTLILIDRNLHFSPNLASTNADSMLGYFLQISFTGSCFKSLKGSRQKTGYFMTLSQKVGR